MSGYKIVGTDDDGRLPPREQAALAEDFVPRVELAKNRIIADNTSAAPIPAGDQTVFHTVGGWTTTSQGAPYTAVTGQWTPIQGWWRFTATLSVVTTLDGSDVMGRLLAAGNRILDYDNKQVIVGGRAWLKLAGRDYFTGVETLEVQVRQDASNPRALAAIAGYNHLDADYLGS